VLNATGSKIHKFLVVLTLCRQTAVNSTLKVVFRATVIAYNIFQHLNNRL